MYFNIHLFLYTQNIWTDYNAVIRYNLKTKMASPSQRTPRVCPTLMTPIISTRRTMNPSGTLSSINCTTPIHICLYISLELMICSIHTRLHPEWVTLNLVLFTNHKSDSSLLYRGVMVCATRIKERIHRRHRRARSAVTSDEPLSY